MEPSVLRRTAAEIAAAALVEVYPNVTLLGGGETPLGFAYEFECPHPVQLNVLEERMRQIVREKRPIRTLEMVAFSASELLKKEGHCGREVGEGLVEVIQIGSFHDLSEGPHLKNTAELAAFKIELEEGRIVGWCASSKEELKKFLKKLSQYTEPEKIGEKMGLWKGDVWLVKGIEFREKLIRFLKKEWFSQVVEVSSPPGGDPLEFHRKLGKGKVGEVWADPERGQWVLQISFFKPGKEEMISCLQSIGKTLTILGFEPTSLSTGFEVEDELGRKWPLVQVKKGKGDQVVVVEIEKIISLLLEKNLLLKMGEL
jgi:hypothetical protein